MRFETLIIGAGAAGMMCAAHARPGVLVVDHAKAPGEKIRISGGGRCNFTNMHASSQNFISANKHFSKSALKRYTQWDFIGLVDDYGIAWHEKTLGQLFCDNSAKDIIAMLRSEMDKAKAQLWLQTSVTDINHDGTHFQVTLEKEGRTVTEAFKNLERLRELRVSHRDLDYLIDRLQHDPMVDQLRIRRLKKRKLLLKDMIAMLESELIPDLDA